MAAKFDVAKRKLRNKGLERSKRNLLSAMFYSNSIVSADDGGQPDKVQKAQDTHEAAAGKLVEMYSKGGPESRVDDSPPSPSPSPPADITAAKVNIKSYMAGKFRALGYGTSEANRLGLDKRVAVPVKLNDDQRRFFTNQSETVSNNTVEVNPEVMPFHNTKVMGAGRLTILGSSWNDPSSNSSSNNNALPPLEVAVPKHSPPIPRYPSSINGSSNAGAPSLGLAIQTLSAQSKSIDWQKEVQQIGHHGNEGGVERISTKGSSSNIIHDGSMSRGIDEGGEEEEEFDDEEEEAVFDRADSAAAKGSSGSGDAVLRKAAQLLKFYKKEVESLSTANKHLVTENFKLLIDNKNISTHLHKAVRVLEQVAPGEGQAVASVPAIDTSMVGVRRAGRHRDRHAGGGSHSDNDSLGTDRSHNSHTSKRSSETAMTMYSSHSQTVGAGTERRVLPADLRGSKPSRIGQNISLSSVTETAAAARSSPPPGSPPAQTVTRQYLVDINNVYIEERRRKLESELSAQRSITESAVRRVRDNYVSQSPGASISSLDSPLSIDAAASTMSPKEREEAARAANSKTSSTSPLLPRTEFKLPYQNLWVAIDSFHSFREAQLAHQAISNDFRSYAAAAQHASPQRRGGVRSSGYGQSPARRRPSPSSRSSRSINEHQRSGGDGSSNSASVSSSGSMRHFNSKYSAVQIRYDMDRRMWVVEGIKNSSLQLHRQQPSPIRHQARSGGGVVERARGRAMASSGAQGGRPAARSLSSQRSIGSNASARSGASIGRSGAGRDVAVMRERLERMSTRSRSGIGGGRRQQQRRSPGGSSSSYQAGRSTRAAAAATMPDIIARPHRSCGDEEGQRRRPVRRRARDRESAFRNAAQATLDSLLMSL